MSLIPFPRLQRQNHTQSVVLALNVGFYGATPKPHSECGIGSQKNGKIHYGYDVKLTTMTSENWLWNYTKLVNIHHTTLKPWRNRKNIDRAVLVVLVLDEEKSTLTIGDIFETVMPQRTYTASYGALLLFEICNLEDAASFQLAIEKRMFGIILIFWVRIEIFETLFCDSPDKDKCEDMPSQKQLERECGPRMEFYMVVIGRRRSIAIWECNSRGNVR